MMIFGIKQKHKNMKDEDEILRNVPLSNISKYLNFKTTIYLLHCKPEYVKILFISAILKLFINFANFKQILTHFKQISSIF